MLVPSEEQNHSRWQQRGVHAEDLGIALLLGRRRAVRQNIRAHRTLPLIGAPLPAALVERILLRR